MNQNIVVKDQLLLHSQAYEEYWVLLVIVAWIIKPSSNLV